MATSSLFTNVRLETENEWEVFLDAVEQARDYSLRNVEPSNPPVWIDPQNNPEAAQAFFAGLKERYAA